MAIYTFDKIAINSTQKVKPLESDKEHYIGLEHIDPECLYITRWGADAAPIGEKLVMKKGDILFGKRRAYQRKVGIAPFDGIFSAHGLVLRPKEDVIIKEFFPFFISSDQFLDRAVQISVGGLSPTVNWSDLARQEFDLPSIEEQKMLADKLWAAYKVKESYRQLLSTTDEMLKAKFQEMFGDVDNNKHNFPVEALGKICECYAGATPSTEKSKYWNGGTIPWMSSGEVHKKFVTYTDAFITTEGYNHSSTKMVPIHSIVVALAGQGKTRGTVAVNEIELCTNQSLCAIVPSSTINYLYLFHNLNSRYLEIRNMAGDIAGRGGLNLKIINSIKVILPPMELQLQFAEIATQAEATKTSLRASIEAIDRVIKSLINQ